MGIGAMGIKNILLDRPFNNLLSSNSFQKLRFKAFTNSIVDFHYLEFPLYKKFLVLIIIDGRTCLIFSGVKGFWIETAQLNRLIIPYSNR